LPVNETLPFRLSIIAPQHMSFMHGIYAGQSVAASHKSLYCTAQHKHSIREIRTMAYADEIPAPRRIADKASSSNARSSTLESVFRLIAEAIESASAARARYPLAD
jgi:hypothetical protein